MLEDRYSRQLHCTATFSQEALSGATALVAGMGGLGSAVSMNLTEAGLGTLILCDYDTIEISNLNRQPLYSEADIGRKKVRVAIERLTEINPEPEFVAVEARFNEKALPALPKPQLILDCLDNLTSRVELVGYAVQNNIPLVHAGVDGFMGQLSVFIPEKSACPVCSIAGSIQPLDMPIPSIGACVSILAGLQAAETIKFLTNSGELCVNKLMFFDGLSGKMETVSLQRDPDCIACSI